MFDKAVRLVVVLACLAVFGIAAVSAQEVPTLEAVYGGRVNYIDAVALDRSVTRIFAATESANSVFYADVDHSLPAPFDTNNFHFSVIPDFDANADFGLVNGIAGHPGSGKVFISHDTGLYTCSTNAGSIVTNVSGFALGNMLLYSDILLIISGNQIVWCPVSESGGLGELSQPVDPGISFPCQLKIAVNPQNDRLYVLDKEAGAVIKKSSDSVASLSTNTTFTDIPITNTVLTWQGRTFGVAPDGRIFVAGNTTNKMIAYCDDDTGDAWSVVDTGHGGVAGDLCFVGDSNAYMVVCGSAVSTNKGENGTWTSLPFPGGQSGSHPNDGPAAADPNAPAVFYFTTDLAIGATTNGGADIFDITEGMAAVQINDFDMTDDKSVAWLASKSGIRRATGFPDAPIWSDAMFPNFDAAPYYAVAVDRADTNGLTAFVGNCRIYKTVDGGENWTLCYGPPEGVTAPIISCLKVYGQNVFAGLYYQNAGMLGGLLLSTNSGNDFEFIELGTDTNGVNVNDILVASNGVYIAAAYDTNAVTGAGHIYLLEGDGSSSKIELSDEPVSIRKLAQDGAGGLYAAGMYTNYAPAIFYKAPAAESWEALPTAGLPEDVRPQANPNWRGPVIAIGTDSSSNYVPVIAVGVKLYYLPADAAEWVTTDSMKYPNGTQINVLYWDDLMVGTDIGLFAHPTRLDPPEPESAMELVAADFDGDGRCDVAAMDNASGTWVAWLSRAGYQISNPYELGIPGLPAAADFDGDRLADPLVLKQNGTVIACFSTAGYTPSAPIPFGVSGYPVAADFDGDGRPDLAVVSTGGVWTVRLSSENYQVGHSHSLGVAGTDVTAGDFDCDGKADPIVVIGSNGQFKIWFSARGYNAETITFGKTGRLLAGDFDADGFADLIAVMEPEGGVAPVYARLSSARYELSGPYNLPLPPQE